MNATFCNLHEFIKVVTYIKNILYLAIENKI